MPRSGDERRARLNDVVVTAGAIKPRLKSGIAMAVHRDRLSALHHEGTVHGDFKPPNFMLERTGNAMLIDIGTAFASEDTSPARRPTSRPTS
jgi:serine/threonine-protein kinase